MQRVITKDLFCNSPVGSISIKVDSAYENTNGFIEYKTTLSIDDLYLEVGRRYNQFKDFDKSLKYHFPEIIFPPLPSKFSLYHRVEQRKKGFHSYMCGLVQLLGLVSADQKATFLRIIAEFFELDGQQETFPVDSIGSSKAMSQSDTSSALNIPGQFQGWIDVRLDENWRTFYTSIKGDCMFLHENTDISKFMYAISLVMGRIQYLSGILELHHDHQSAPICFKCPESPEFQKALLIACSSNTDSPLSQYKKSCAGRLSVTIHSARNLRFPKPPVSMVRPHIFIAVSVDCFNFNTEMLAQLSELHWGQTFIMPIFNIFFDLKISVCAVTTEGWVKQHVKTEVLDSIKIPLTDINQPPFSTGTVALGLDKTKIDRKSLCEKPPDLLVTIKQQSSLFSYFVPPALHYIEDLPLPDQASMHDLKIALKRLKRVRLLYVKMLRSIYQTFFWIYPDFSKLCLLLFCTFVLFLPGQFFLPIFFIVILIFLTLMNPENKKALRKVRRAFFSKEKHVYPFPRVITIKEALHLKKCRIEILKEKVEEGVMKRWKKFKEDAVELQNYMMLLACYGEKLRQLFLWEDPQKSKLFSIGLVLLILVLTLMPFRLILLVAGVHRFYKGYKFTRKRIAHNKKVAEEVLGSLFSQYLSDCFLRVSSNELWSREILDNSSVQKKIVEGIRSRLSIDVDTDIFSICKSPLELSNYIGSAATLLKHKDNKGEHVYDIQQNHHDNLLWGFLTNIPSEFYRFEHPRVSSVAVY